MRMALLTEGGYPYVDGDTAPWCDRLVRGLADHQFDVYALSHGPRRERAGLVPLPGNVRQVRTAPLWPAPEAALRARHGRRARRRFAECYGELVAAVCATGPAPGEQGDASARWPARQEQDGAEPDGRRPGPGRLGRLGRPGRRRTGDGPAVREQWHQVADVAGADRFAGALYALADIARDEGAPAALLRSEGAVRTWEHACRAPGAPSAVRAARVADLLAVADAVQRLLGPLSLDWYATGALGSADLCHAMSGGAAALPGLLARYYGGVPLLLTEHDMALRTHYLTRSAASAPVQALLTAFHGHLAAETYRQAVCITSGSARARHWQERYGAARAKLRTVHPGIDAAGFAGTGGSDAPGEPGTLVWAGRIEPGTDLVSLLHAFAQVHRALPRARLRIVGESAPGADAAGYAARCRALAAQLFPDAAGEVRGGRGERPVSFAEGPVSFEDGGGGSPVHGGGAGAGGSGGSGGDGGAGSREGDGRLVGGGGPVLDGSAGGVSAAWFAACYAAASVVIPSSTVGFPVGVVVAMLCGRATVSTDTGQVADVVGRTGLVVPPRDPRALAEACLSLLHDADRRALLGAAARARALELFTVEQNIAAFDRIYRDIADSCPVPRSRTAAGNAARGAGGPRASGPLPAGRGAGAVAEGVLGSRRRAVPVGEGAR